MSKYNPRTNAEGYPDPTAFAAERHVRAQLAGRQARAAGEHFENMITASCAWYERHGYAKIEKTPEPMKPLGPKDSRGQFKACYTKQAQPDYGGTLKGGQSVYFECKHTDNDRMFQSRLTAEQCADLEAHHQLGALTFVLVSFGLTDFYRIPWIAWRDMGELFGRKYVKPVDLEQFEVPAVSGCIRFLDRVIPYGT